MDFPDLLLARDLTIDLGSSYFVVCSARRQLLVRERARYDPPAEPRRRRRSAAHGLLGPLNAPPAPRRPPAVAPVRHGRVADVRALDAVLERVAARALPAPWLSWAYRGANTLVVPPVLEREAHLRLEDAVARNGLGPVRPVALPQALALAVGGEAPRACMLADVGGGKTCLVALSAWGMVGWHWADVGAEALDEAIVHHVEQRHRVRLSPGEAERVKREIGSAYPLKRPETLEVSGQQTRSGLPQKLTLDDSEIRDRLLDGCEALVLAIQQAFRGVPPEVASDIAREGLILLGGGALLRGLPDFLHERLELPVRVGEDPINATVRGAQRWAAGQRLAGARGRAGAPRLEVSTGMHGAEGP